VEVRYLILEFVWIILLILDKDIFVVHHLFHRMEEDEREWIVMMMGFDHCR
jgi:hypothetical protein